MAAATHFNDWPNAAGFNTDSEQREPISLVVKGHIPAYASGTLYRTGPASHTIEGAARGDFSLSHWFDGFSHVYRFEMIAKADGSCDVVYNSRRQVDELVDKIRKTGRLDTITFGQKREPCTSVFQKLKIVFMAELRRVSPLVSNVSVTIAPNVPGLDSLSKVSEKTSDSRLKNLVTFTDFNAMKKIDPDTLEPIGVADQTMLHPDLKGQLSAAHAQFDPVTGDIYNYNLEFGASITYRVFRTSTKTGKTEILATIKGSDIKPAYIHSSFLTEDFFILPLWSSHFVSHGAKILWNRNIIDSIAFDSKDDTIWLVVDRRHGRGLVAKFHSPAAFAFHTVNAWQEEFNGKLDIFCDVVQYSHVNVLHRLYYENLISTGPGVGNYSGNHREDIRATLVRHRLAGIPMTSSDPALLSHPQRTETILTLSGPDAGDLPTINPHYATKKSRYVYSIIDRGHSSFVDAIAKTDVETKTATIWEQMHHTPGEPIFVPDPDEKSEDAGVLLSVMLNGATGTSYLLCLDARTMQELGRAEVDVAVGIGFHGRHVPLGI